MNLRPLNYESLKEILGEVKKRNDLLHSKWTTIIYFFYNHLKNYDNFYYRDDNDFFLVFVSHENKKIKHLNLINDEPQIETIMRIMTDLKIRDYKIIFLHRIRNILATLKKSELLKNLTVYNSFVYIYLTEKLIGFPGKSMQKKRNLYNNFVHAYADKIEIIDIKDANKQELVDYVENWRVAKIEHSIDHEEKYGLYHECFTTQQILLNWEKHYYSGLAWKHENKVQGIIFGNITDKNDELVEMMVSKTSTEFKGAYQYMLSEVLRRNFPNVKYVSLGDDECNLSLRKNKLSYHPAYIIDKWDIICELA